MTIQQMREKVLAAYPDSRTLPARLSRMSDAQIIAIFMRLCQKGQIKS